MVLFLDFDGVTHAVSAPVNELFASNYLIEGVLRLHPHVDVVFSTSWRDHYSLDELRNFFAEDLRARFIGVTPSLFKGPAKRDREPDYPRQWEILCWIRDNRPGAQFVAVDDMPHWFSPGCEWLLRTEPMLGFTADDAIELDRMLVERTS